MGYFVLRKLYSNYERIFTPSRILWRSYRKPSHDADFFAPDRRWTPERAWLLGFIFADGYVNKNGVHFQQKATDIEILENVRDIVKSTLLVRCYSRLDKRTLKTYHACRFGMHSKKTAADVAALGAFQAKSLVLKWPETIPAEFVSHFVRGYFDGDGCISFDRKANCVLQFAGTYQFLSYLRNYFIKTLSLQMKGCISADRIIFALCFKGKPETILEILDHIYINSSAKTRLRRKHERYLLFQEMRGHKPVERLELWDRFKQDDC